MKGCSHAAARDYEIMIENAWRGANFSNAGSKLKNLSEYLPRSDGAAPKIKPEAVLDAMLTMKAHGVPMTIKRVDKQPGGTAGVDAGIQGRHKGP